MNSASEQVSHPETPASQFGFWNNEDNIERVFAWLVIFQLLAAPLALLREFVPPVIGVGSFSFVVDIRYLAAVLFGATLALPVFAAFAFAWSSRSLLWRFFICVPLIAVVGMIGVTSYFILMVGRWARFWRHDWEYLFQEGLGVFGLLFSACVGIACLPLFFRALRGCSVSETNSSDLIGKGAQYREWVIFVAVSLFVLSFSSGLGDDTGLGILAGLFGIVVGLLISPFVFLFLREQSLKAFQAVLTISLLIFVLLPTVGFWLSDFSRLNFLPAGNGSIFIGFASGAVLFIIQLMLLRRLGFQIRKSRFERVVAKPKKEVVDPFSD